MMSNRFMYDFRLMPDRRPSQTLLTAAQIQTRVAELAREIRGDYPEGLHIIAVLKGAFIFLSDLVTTLDGKDVLIVEDIVDTGLTLTYLQDILRARGPRVLRTACLLSKPSRRKIDVKVEYIGFSIEDRFVVGYGLDYAEQFRNLPYIGVIES